MASPTNPQLSPKSARLQAAAADPPSIPDHVPIRPIGCGAYGVVWLARNIMGHYRAVKVVHRAHFNDHRPYEREFDGIKRFEPISRSHESQLDILHVGRNDDAGNFYYVMELADDANAEDNFRRGSIGAASDYEPRTLKSDQVVSPTGRLAVKQCVEIGLKLAEALHHLHSNGLVHRDVKPSNIIFVNGIPKLADIGLVTGTDETQSCPGTEGFAAPEGTGTPAADIYALGKVLYELSTGKDRLEYPEPVTELADLPDRKELLELNEVVHRACQHDPKNRYTTALAMRDELLLLRAGHSLAGMRRIQRRLRTALRLIVASAALLMIVGGGWYYTALKEREAQEARMAMKAALLEAKVSQAGMLVQSHVSGQRFEALRLIDEARDHTNKARLRTLVLRAMALPDAKPWKEIPATQTKPRMTFDRRLTLYASNDASNIILLRDLDTDEVKWRLHPPAELSGVAQHALQLRLNSSGTAFHALFPEGVLLTWELTAPGSSSPKVRTTRFNTTALDVYPSPDDSLLAVRHSQGTDVYNLNSGHLRFQITNSLAGTYFSPGGRFMALPSGTNVLVLSCTDGSVAAQHVVQDGQVITAATWVDDEDHFAIALQQNRSEVYGCEIRILDLPQGAIRNKLYGHFHHISGLDYLPGKVLASTGWDGSTVLWDTASAAKLLELKIGGGSVHLSPDGRRILWESPGRSALVVWRSELTPELTRLDLPSHGWPLDLSPYGLLATESNTRKSWFIPSLSLTANYRLADGLYAILTAADLSCTYALGNGPTGYGLLFRSPLEYDFTKQQLFSGPPSLLPLGTKEADWLRLSPDGHHAWVRHKSGFCIVHWEGSPSVTWPTGGWPTDFSISREGRLVASAHPTGMSPPGIRVWDGLTGALMHELPNSRRDVSPRLSPDGRWLLTHCRDQSGFRLYEAPNWVLRRTFTNDFHKSAVAEFNQEGSIATLFYSDRSMVFMETRTWNEICRIPFGGNLNRALFSTDDSQFVMGSESGHTEIWDLRLVRSRLSAMGLDFPVPSLPEPAPSAGINPRQLVIRPGMHLLPVANP